jgi:hypothetical protein
MDSINTALYILLSLLSNVSVPNIQFALQGCRAILVDKDQNPKVQIISDLAHLHQNLLLTDYLIWYNLFCGTCSGRLQGWKKCMTRQLRNISQELMIHSGKIWTYPHQWSLGCGQNNTSCHVSRVFLGWRLLLKWNGMFQYRWTYINEDTLCC